MNGLGKTLRHGKLTAQLRDFLHPDVIPLVLNYEATIQFELQRSFGAARGALDGEMDNPSGLLLHADELFVVDQGNHRILVFHEGTGRFLRKWGQPGSRDGEFLNVKAIALGRSRVEHHPNESKTRNKVEVGIEAEIFVADIDEIQVFHLHDNRFLRRFKIEENSSFSFTRGIAVMGDEILVSRSSPHQVDVMRKSDGKRLRILGGMTFHTSPKRLLVDETAKELWLADPGKYRILVLDVMSGNVLRQYDEKILCPEAVVCHGDEVIVSDFNQNRLVVFERSTSRMLRCISMLCSLKNGQFRNPSDLAISLRNELFVCDSGNCRVLIFQ